VTPAVAAGVTDRAGDLEELIGVPLIGRLARNTPKGSPYIVQPINNMGVILLYSYQEIMHRRLKCSPNGFKALGQNCLPIVLVG